MQEAMQNGLLTSLQHPHKQLTRVSWGQGGSTQRHPTPTTAPCCCCWHSGRLCQGNPLKGRRQLLLDSRARIAARSCRHCCHIAATHRRLPPPKCEAACIWQRGQWRRLLAALNPCCCCLAARSRHRLHCCRIAARSRHNPLASSHCEAPLPSHRKLCNPLLLTPVSFLGNQPSTSPCRGRPGRLLLLLAAATAANKQRLPPTSHRCRWCHSLGGRVCGHVAAGPACCCCCC